MAAEARPLHARHGPSCSSTSRWMLGPVASLVRRGCTAEDLCAGLAQVRDEYGALLSL